MNRKAKRNKYKNETAVLNFEIKSLRCERDKYIDYWCTANCKNAKLSLDLDKSEEEKNKYKDKYYEQLKKEFLDGAEERRKSSVCKIGRHWFNNGIENKFVYECPGEGWLRGKITCKK